VVPNYFLFEYLLAKNKITRHVLDTYRRPGNYEMMYKLLEILEDIRSRPLKIDIGPIGHLLESVRGKNFHRTVQNVKHICDYNPWGTVTGRLATNPASFPILTMNKEFRACIQPQNDWLLELDFNAAELRILLALAGVEQPKNDIHDWNVKHVFGGKLSRADAKTKTFAWLYSQRSNSLLERLYNKDLVQNKYWDGFKIETDYGRIIENVDERHALNYIVQSTTIDMVHEQACKVYEALRGMKSNIAFLIHDALYIDLAEEDRYEILNLLDIFKKTRYDMFKVNIAAGKNLGALKELKL
jgi:DNA polymerase I-like protein with 3'-5' exonuclease and polymerase domains